MMELAEGVIELHTSYPTRFRGGQQSTDTWMRGWRIGCGLIMRDDGLFAIPRVFDDPTRVCGGELETPCRSACINGYLIRKYSKS
jgi:hypothetical protein